MDFETKRKVKNKESILVLFQTKAGWIKQQI